MRCPKCGNDMLKIDDSVWRLYEIRTVDYICPNCLHVEKVKTITLRKEH